MPARTVTENPDRVIAKVVVDANKEEPVAAATPAASAVFGNVKAWQTVREWLSGRTHGASQGPKVLLLRGPSGVGKTSGVHAHATRSNRKLVEINVCDVIASNLDQTIREGCTRAAITADGETSDATAGLVLIDDLEAYPAESLRILTQTLKDLNEVSGIVCTCSTGFRTPPSWKDLDYTTVHLSLLTIQELCQVARCDAYFAKWTTPSLMRLAAMADGDARRMQNIMHMQRIQTNAGEAPNDELRLPEKIPDNVFNAVKKMLYGRQPSVARIERINAVYDTQFATDLTFANYVDAFIGDDIGVVGEAAELLSCGDVMRYGPMCAQLDEARIVQFGITTLKKVTKTTAPHVLRCPERSGPTLDLKSSYLRERHGPAS